MSVIVPVRDAKPDVRGLIEALSAQTLPRERFEIVVGDDGSIDGVSDLATADGWVRVVCGPPLNSYAARNRAVRASRAPALAFCDADCRPLATWLEAGLGALEEADLVAGYIQFTLPERPSLWALLEIDQFKDHARQVQLANAETANLFVQREWFDRVRGFDDHLPSHGDFDFVSRCVEAGARLDFAARAVTMHSAHGRAGWFLRKMWTVNRAYAARATRAGKRANALKIREWIPILQTVRARRRFQRSLVLDRRRLTEHGIDPRLWDDLRALPIIYLLLPYLSGVAQLRGWYMGRRSSRIDMQSLGNERPSGLLDAGAHERD